jgi:hypothetical protein
MSTITLKCPDCGRVLTVPRLQGDPPLATMAVLQCISCDDGDRHAPEYFNASGGWVNPVEHLKD